MLMYRNPWVKRTISLSCIQRKMFHVGPLMYRVLSETGPTFYWSVFSGCLIRTSNVHSVVLPWTYLLSISGSVVGPSSPTHTTLSSFSPSLDKGEAGKSTRAVTGEGGGDFSHTSGISENIKQHSHSLLLRRKGKLSITVSVCALLFVQIID